MMKALIIWILSITLASITAIIMFPALLVISFVIGFVILLIYISYKLIQFFEN